MDIIIIITIMTTITLVIIPIVISNEIILSEGCITVLFSIEFSLSVVVIKFVELK